MIKIFYDLETTGTDYRKHGIHQIAMQIEVDGKLVEKADFYVQPHPKAIIDPAALKLCSVVEEDFEMYDTVKDVHSQILALLGKHIDHYDKKCKAYLVGYNNRAFDDQFFRMWFELCGDSYFGSWFWPDTLDVLVLASQHLIYCRPEMPSFKLARVAKELGLNVEESRLHEGQYDCTLTREIYKIVTK